MNFKKYLIVISMILASAAAFAKSQAVTEDGYFVNNTFNTIYGVVIFSGDYSDGPYVTVAGKSLDKGTSVYDFEIGPGAEVPYSVVLSGLKSTIIMRLAASSEQLCDWYVHPNTIEPEARGSNPPACTLTGAYTYVMRNPTK